MSWLIYMHRNKINGKVYIGQTKLKTEERWRNGAGYTSNAKTRFSRAIQKYGWDSFEHIILEDNIPTQQEANNRERYYIAQHNAYNFDYGYNMTLGGNSVSEGSLEKARMAIKLKKENEINFIFCYELLKLFPNPTIALEYFLDNGFVNNYHGKNPIYRALDKENATCFGVHFCRIINMLSFKPKSKEMSNKAKGHTKKIICVDTGDIYNSLSECWRITGIKTQHLSKACKTNRPTHGMYFAYLDKYDASTWQRYIKEKKTSPLAKPVFCFELNKEWESCAACCEELDISSGELSRLLQQQDPSNIYHTAKGLHFCYANERAHAVITERVVVKKNSRKVYCVELGKLYRSSHAAEKELNIHNILKCCKDWRYTSGGYHWCFEGDINSYTHIEQIDRAYRNKLIKRVIKVETGEVFESMSSACRSIHRDMKTLREAINTQRECGGFHWKFAD